MKGVILTGLTGVGKTTAQAALCQHGFWIPHTCTTRPVDPAETATIHYSREEFLTQVQAGTIVLPACFGDHWYGWPRVDLERLQDRKEPAALNVRPYTALLLEALCRDLVAVWLDLGDTELARRRAQRSAPRDIDESLYKQRRPQDEADSIYKNCFSNILFADDTLIPRLLVLSHG